MRTFYLDLAVLGWKRRRVGGPVPTAAELADVRAAVSAAQADIPESVGVPRLTFRLRTHGTPGAPRMFFPRQVIARVVRELDPTAPGRRVRNKLVRRAQIIRGVFHTLHGDQNDKLAALGFPLYAVVDGRSRFILYLGILNSNRMGHDIATHYLDIVEQYASVPVLYQSDWGTETGETRLSQVW